MATPRVFVSSTYYDLKYIRENLKYFIRTIGYEPTLSEEGDVFYNPKQHTHDSCINEVPSCQIFVLIIGGRFGGKFKGTDKSITNTEYTESIKQKIPVFALIEASVYAEHNVYIENVKQNGKAKADAMAYPSVDNVRIFEFIDEVRKNAINNAIVPFRDFSDIEAYLKKQWAGMMFSFLTTLSEEERVSDTLSELTKMSEKIEFLSKQILNSVGSDKAKLTIKLYDAMIKYGCFRDLVYTEVKPTPQDILKAKNLKDIGKNFNVDIRTFPESKKGDTFYSISPDGSMSFAAFNRNSKEFDAMKIELNNIVKENGWTIKDFLTE
jgi:Domain of unknown function (DUF4062)